MKWKEIKQSIRCRFEKHERVYITRKECEKNNWMTGVFTPWKCKYCNKTSQVFVYPLYNGMEKTILKKGSILK